MNYDYMLYDLGIPGEDRHSITTSDLYAFPFSSFRSSTSPVLLLHSWVDPASKDGVGPTNFVPAARIHQPQAQEY